MQAPPAQFATKRGANTGSSKVRYFKKLLFRVGVGLDVVPSMKTALEDRYPASATSSSIHAKTWSTVSEVNR